LERDERGKLAMRGRGSIMWQQGWMKKGRVGGEAYKTRRKGGYA